MHWNLNYAHFMQEISTLRYKWFLDKFSSVLSLTLLGVGASVVNNK